jgi:predicted dehydrogenase
MERLSIGLVGCGRMGRRHLLAYGRLRQVGGARIQLAAVCDANRLAAEQAADLAQELLGSRPAVFVDPAHLIAAGAVEALDVVTGPSTHHMIAAPALEQGLHVICEKPLGVTVGACRAMLDAAAGSGAVLATAENYRRDPPNRLARAVIEHGLLGQIHLMVQLNVGGDDAVILSPWRHLRESGSIALDMGVHYTDIFRYYLGELESASGSAFIAEPFRVLAEPTPRGHGIDEVSPGVMRATGEDSLVAFYETKSTALIQLAYVPSGPGERWIQRTVHGREGSMSVPPDRSGGAVTVQLGNTSLSGAALRRELGGFELDGVTGAFFGPTGTEYDLAFAEVDAATIAIELDDFADALARRRPPEVDGRGGLEAVAAVWAVAESRDRGRVRIADVTDGTVSAAQDAIDSMIGVFPQTKGARL